jgi:hypothetical protein
MSLYYVGLCSNVLKIYFPGGSGRLGVFIDRSLSVALSLLGGLCVDLVCVFLIQGFCDSP